MSDETPETTDAELAASSEAVTATKPPRKRAPRKAAAPVVDPFRAGPSATPESVSAREPAVDVDQQAPVKRARKSASRKVIPPVFEPGSLVPGVPAGDAAPAVDAPAAAGDEPAAAGATAPAAKRTPRKRAAKAAAVVASPLDGGQPEAAHVATESSSPAAVTPALAAPPVLFQPPTETAPRRRGSRTPRKVAQPVEVDDDLVVDVDLVAGELDESVIASFDDLDIDTDLDSADLEDDDVAFDDVASDDVDESQDAPESGGAQGSRRRRRRGRRGRGPRPAEGDAAELAAEDGESADDADEDSTDAEGEDSEDSDSALSPSARRRRRRRRSTSAGDAEVGDDDPPNTEVHVREPKSGGNRGGGAADSDGVRGVKGSTRLEAKRQRRRDSRDSGRRRAPILTESEFLARRESVERVMAVHQTADRTQIAVLEDGILVEHYVTRESAASAVGNVYLGRVQNVLPSMEAAFVDIGRGRNGVLYAGEVNWDAAGLEGKSRSIENALNSGDAVLVQVTKDPIGHKGARLTSQISLPGRFVVYVPGGGMTGISRKLPDTERSRLKAILKKVVPDEAGVIVRTAAEGASEADLISDVERLKAQWETIQTKNAAPSNAPSLVYGEPDLAIRVVRDVFNDDFSQLFVSGSDSYATLTGYIGDIAPSLRERISLHTGESDLFADLRVDEQLAKALDRKVWLPSGGSLVIDRTEAMTVVDVNTGKYTGSGGNLEQTVTRNNLEAAEEVVRQLRLRDIGGIIVIDFIDMVLESNRELVLRRLTECLGRDRTKHQVAEVTSLGLVQMTRKRVGEGLLEAFSEPCEHCKGRGVILHTEPTFHDQDAPAGDEEERPGRSRRGRRAKSAAVVADPEIDAVVQSQRRAAAAAIAAIAAATAVKDPAVEAAASSTPVDEAAAEPAADESGNTQAATDNAATDNAATDGGPANVGAGGEGAVTEGSTAEGAASEGPAVETGSDGDVPVDSAAASTPAAAESAPRFGADDAVQPPAGTSRPRRRRAASRPAGPPVAVTAGTS